jgi:FeoB-associated Cys-rich membrane protein
MQTFIVILIFVFAVGYLGRRAYQSLSLKKAGCGKGCGCEQLPVISKQLSMSNSNN